jgi:hypothetical protein
MVALQLVAKLIANASRVAVNLFMGLARGKEVLVKEALALPEHVIDAALVIVRVLLGLAHTLANVVGVLAKHVDHGHAPHVVGNVAGLKAQVVFGNDPNGDARKVFLLPEAGNVLPDQLALLARGANRLCLQPRNLWTGGSVVNGGDETGTKG